MGEEEGERPRTAVYTAVYSQTGCCNGSRYSNTCRCDVVIIFNWF